MNLGVEDAYVYAACAEDIIKGCAERIEDYSRLRHPIHKTVVSRMDRLTGLGPWSAQVGWPIAALSHSDHGGCRATHQDHA
jgi:hypothetical protein